MSESVFGALDGKSPALFLLGGVLLILFAGATGVNELTELSYTNWENTFGPAGFVFGFLGLLGLYPKLADRKRTLARAAALFAGFGAVGFSVVALRNLAEIVGVGFPSWLQVVTILAFAGFLLGYTLFGVTSLVTDVHSLTVGLLLLTPVGIFGVMLSGVFDAAAGDAVADVLLSSGQAIAHLAIGYALWTDGVPTDHAEQVADPSV